LDTTTAPVEGPTPRSPGSDINCRRWADAIGCELPVFVDPDLWFAEFTTDTDARVVGMILALLESIDKALATEAGDKEVIPFRYFRRISAKATKMKPEELTASLYMNPDYGIVWCRVERA
jgi:hypothetical protein